MIMTAEGKKLSARQAKELADLEAGAELPKETGERRGSLKQSTTQLSKAKANSEKQQLNATERQALLAQHRHLASPKSGSKSDSVLLELSPQSQTQVLLGQKPKPDGWEENLPKSDCPPTVSSEALRRADARAAQGATGSGGYVPPKARQERRVRRRRTWSC